jgi:translation initiation factor IF-2
VQAVFSRGSGKAAGCMITEGKVMKDCDIHVIRKGKTVHTGKIDTLRRVKEDVKEVSSFSHSKGFFFSFLVPPRAPWEPTVGSFS